MQFKTLNSTYEVDTVNKMIRRLDGVENPTPRQGPDGVWKPYLDIYNLNTSQSAVIAWEYVDGILKTTMTSEITEVIL